MFETIVVGFDGSELAVKALETALDLAKLTGAQVHVVYAPQPHTVAFAMGAVAGYHAVTTMPQPAELELANAAVVAAAEGVAQTKDATIEVIKIMTGDPGDELVRYADMCDADLIVTGRRGLGALGALMQGSTSLRVNHTARCASLSVI